MPTFQPRNTNNYCTFVVFRRKGGYTDTAMIGKEIRKAIDELNATLDSVEKPPCKFIKDGDRSVETNKPPKEDKDVLWHDWYRVSLANQSLEYVKGILRKRGITNGPFHGGGRESAATGAGELKPGQRPSSLVRKRFRELQSNGTNLHTDIILAVFGSYHVLPQWTLQERMEAYAAIDDIRLPSNWEQNRQAWIEDLVAWEKSPSHLLQVVEYYVKKRLDIASDNVSTNPDQYDYWFACQRRLETWKERNLLIASRDTKYNEVFRESRIANTRKAMERYTVTRPFSVALQSAMFDLDRMPHYGIEGDGI